MYAGGAGTVCAPSSGLCCHALTIAAPSAFIQGMAYTVTAGKTDPSIIMGLL